MIVFFRFAQASAESSRTEDAHAADRAGIVFGVGSVIGMMAIGAGAREESLRFIEQLGVRNMLVDSRQATSQEEFQQRRRSSPGLTERDVRILRRISKRSRRFRRGKTLHPAQRPAETGARYSGVVRRPALVYAPIHSLQFEEGRFFDEADDENSALVCVLGETRESNLLGYGPAVGKFVKVNDTWLRGGGRAAANSSMAGAQNSGGTMQDVNNIIYIPFNTFQYRFWDQQRLHEDELDGIECG